MPLHNTLILKRGILLAKGWGELLHLATVEEGDEAGDIEIEGAAPGASFIGFSPDLHKFRRGTADLRAHDGEGGLGVFAGRRCGIDRYVDDIFEGLLETCLSGGEVEMSELIVADAEGGADAPGAKAEHGEKRDHIGLLVIRGMAERGDDGRDVQEEVTAGGGAVG